MKNCQYRAFDDNKLIYQNNTNVGWFLYKLRDDAILMENTYFLTKDKNGIPEYIFEGDITYFNNTKRRPFYATVTWDKSRGAWGYCELQLNKNGGIEEMINLFCDYDEIEHDFLPYITIVGNKYENGTNYNIE